MNNISNKTLVALIAEPKDEQWYLYRDELLRRLEEAENLKCCGNCKHYTPRGDCRSKHEYRPGHYCDFWQSDALTRKDREK